MDLLRLAIQDVRGENLLLGLKQSRIEEITKDESELFQARYGEYLQQFLKNSLEAGLLDKETVARAWSESCLFRAIFGYQELTLRCQKVIDEFTGVKLYDLLLLPKIVARKIQEIDIRCPYTNARLAFLVPVSSYDDHYTIDLKFEVEDYFCGFVKNMDAISQLPRPKARSLRVRLG